MKKRIILYILLLSIFLVFLFARKDEPSNLSNIKPNVLPTYSDEHTTSSINSPSISGISGLDGADNTSSNSETSHNTSQVESSIKTQSSTAISSESSLNQTSASDEEDNVDKHARIDELVSIIYELKDYYTNELASIENKAQSNFSALPQDSQTTKMKQKIALECADLAYDLEKQCDGQMNEICEELGLLLIETDGDLKLVSEIKYTYALEKITAKTHYTDLYSKYLN